MKSVQRILLCGALFLTACGSIEPTNEIQLCWQNNEGRNEFLIVLQEFANSHGLTYLDESDSLRERMGLFMGLLENDTTNDFSRMENLTDVVLRNEDDSFYVLATNLGLTRDEVYVAVFESDRTHQSITDDLIGTLKGKWQTYEVPENRGALPLENCPAVES